MSGFRSCLKQNKNDLVYLKYQIVGGVSSIEGWNLGVELDVCNEGMLNWITGLNHARWR
jgi:hypothetical protein